MERLIIGWKVFKGEVDGQAIDSGKIYTTVALDDTKGNAKGVVAAEWRLPSSAVVEPIKHLELPSLCDCEMREVSDGKGGMRIQITGLRPAAPAPVKRAA